MAGVLLAIALGCWLSSEVAIPHFAWLVGTTLSLACFWLAHRRESVKLTSILILASTFSLSAVYSQLRLNVIDSQDLSHIATSAPQPVHLLGTLNSVPLLWESLPGGIRDCAPSSRSGTTTPPSESRPPPHDSRCTPPPFALLNGIIPLRGLSEWKPKVGGLTCKLGTGSKSGQAFRSGRPSKSW